MSTRNIILLCLCHQSCQICLLYTCLPTRFKLTLFLQFAIAVCLLISLCVCARVCACEQLVVIGVVIAFYSAAFPLTSILLILIPKSEQYIISLSSYRTLYLTITILKLPYTYCTRCFSSCHHPELPRVNALSTETCSVSVLNRTDQKRAHGYTAQRLFIDNYMKGRQTRGFIILCSQYFLQ